MCSYDPILQHANILIKSRGASRGGRGAPFRGGRGGGGSGPPASSTEERKKREAILDLSKYVNERIRVKFTGGREGTPFAYGLDQLHNKQAAVTGVLKGYDQLLNLVLDEVQEEIQGKVIPRSPTKADISGSLQSQKYTCVPWV